MAWTVGRVAKAAGVSVRTLHHYDALGLVRPSGRSAGGYREYARADLERLSEVLYFRELGFPLAEIARLVATPRMGRRASLLLRRRLLVERAARTHALLGAIDRALAALDKGETMADDGLLEVFGDFDPKQHEEEARRRWGDSEAWRESQRRTKRYTKADWARMGLEADAINRELAMLAAAGRAPDAPECVALAERHRQLIDRWFYPCSHEIHRALGEMYVADDRFAQHYERVRPGLTRFLRDAIASNAERPFVVGHEEEPAKAMQKVRRR